MGLPLCKRERIESFGVKDREGRERVNTEGTDRVVEIELLRCSPVKVGPMYFKVFTIVSLNNIVCMLKTSMRRFLKSVFYFEQHNSNTT